MFADIKGSTELMRELDPEEARAVIDPVLQLMMDAVHRYDGYVVQSIGDGIFALFGAPVAHEDHPHRAVHAAIAMRDALRRRDVDQPSRPAAEVRIGINTGEVVMRLVHTGGHTEYTPVGHAANLAARMQSAAPAGGIIISADTRHLVEGYFELHGLGPTEIKGIDEPLDVYEVIRAGPLHGHFELAVQRGLTKFVGREREIAKIMHALELSKRCHGQIVAVVGEAGTGKSRLFHEFKRLLSNDCMVLETHSVPYGKASAYQPVLELLYSYFGIESGDNGQHRYQKILTRVAELDPALEDVVPYIAALLGTRDTAEPPVQIEMDSPVRRRWTLEALKQVFLCKSINQPVILIFEDLHWFDDESQALLNLIADSIANARVLFLVSYRPEYRHEWGRKSHYTRLRLDPLAKDSAKEMLDALLGDDHQLGPLKHLIIDKTAGNPFFMEEIVQALTERGVLVPTGAVKQVRPLTRFEIPPTVQRILASRIDRLAPDEKELLQTLAVMGREFRMQLIKLVVSGGPLKLQSSAAISREPGGGSEILEAILAKLQLGEFIYEEPALHDSLYRFKHALTQEVAYNSVLTERRKLLHERTAAAIEALFSDRPDDHLAELAHHYSQSANLAKAAKYLSLAGRQAAGRAAHREALVYFADGLKLLEKLALGRERAELELPLQIGRGFSLRATNGFTAPEVEQTLVRARELCGQVNNMAQLFNVLVGLHTYYLYRRPGKSGALAKDLLSVAEGLRESPKIAIGYLAMGETAMYLGDFRRSREYLERTIALAASDRPDQQNARGYLAVTLWCLGYPEQSVRRMREALALTQEQTLPLRGVNILAYACQANAQARRWQASREHAEAGISLANQYSFVFHAHWFAVVHGRALMEHGDLEKGIAEMRRGIAGLDALGAIFAFVLGYYSEGCLKIGTIEEGLRALARAVRLSEETGERWQSSELHRLRGESLLMQDSSKLAEAENCFHTAQEIAQAQSAKSFELRAITSLARVLKRQGRHDEARKRLSEIYGWFTEGFDTPDLHDARELIDELSH
jgi:class 3 adenylate cyclase/tetratricopeptide (TPR) repeat protein